MLAKINPTVYLAWALALEGIQGPIYLSKNPAIQERVCSTKPPCLLEMGRVLTQKGRSNWNYLAPSVS